MIVPWLPLLLFSNNIMWCELICNYLPRAQQVNHEKGYQKSYISVSNSISQNIIQSMQFDYSNSAGPGWLNELGSCRVQVIKFTSCLPMVGGSLRVLRLLWPLKLVAMIKLKYCSKNQIKIKSNSTPAGQCKW
jgi:hypothetical protein